MDSFHPQNNHSARHHCHSHIPDEEAGSGGACLCSSTRKGRARIQPWESGPKAQALNFCLVQDGSLMPSCLTRTKFNGRTLFSCLLAFLGEGNESFSFHPKPELGHVFGGVWEPKS